MQWFAWGMCVPVGGLVEEAERGLRSDEGNCVKEERRTNHGHFLMSSIPSELMGHKVGSCLLVVSA